MVTAAEAGDGATTAAIALALAGVRMDQRVILVDANWSSPDLSRRLQLSADRGLGAVSSDGMDVEGLLRSTPILGLSAVAAGPKPMYSQRLLNSQGFRRALRRLAEVADLVIVDAPPVLGELDISGLAAGGDGTVVVVRAASTRQSAVREACDILAVGGAPVLGVVLTNASSQEGFSSNHQEWEPQAESVAAAGGDGHVSNVSSVEERK
jgi:Mrp family chromosome partitioning ATPase